MAIDPETLNTVTALVTTGAGAAVAKPLLERMFGPTAEYIGAVNLGLVKKADVNLGQIFAKAVRRLGRKLEDPGQVPPRVLRAIVSEGAFCEDDLAQEYFAGVLASSRTEAGKDDRAASLVAVLRAMSIYQVRLHYAIHRAVRELLVGRDIKLQFANQRFAAEVYLPRDPLAAALGIDGEDDPWTAVIGHALAGSDRLGLINGEWAEGLGRGLKSGLRPKLPEDAGHGIVASPGAFGIELMLAVHGHGDAGLNALLDPALDFQMDGSPPAIAGALLTRQ